MLRKLKIGDETLKLSHEQVVKHYGKEVYASLLTRKDQIPHIFYHSHWSRIKITNIDPTTLLNLLNDTTFTKACYEVFNLLFMAQDVEQRLFYFVCKGEVYEIWTGEDWCPVFDEGILLFISSIIIGKLKPLFKELADFYEHKHSITNDTAQKSKYSTLKKKFNTLESQCSDNVKNFLDEYQFFCFFLFFFFG